MIRCRWCRVSFEDMSLLYAHATWAHASIFARIQRWARCEEDDQSSLARPNERPEPDDTSAPSPLYLGLSDKRSRRRTPRSNQTRGRYESIERSPDDEEPDS